jgi:hypothetical protein
MWLTTLIKTYRIFRYFITFKYIKIPRYITRKNILNYPFRMSLNYLKIVAYNINYVELNI